MKVVTTSKHTADLILSHGCFIDYHHFKAEKPYRKPHPPHTFPNPAPMLTFHNTQQITAANQNSTAHPKTSDQATQTSPTPETQDTSTQTATTRRKKGTQTQPPLTIDAFQQTNNTPPSPKPLSTSSTSNSPPPISTYPTNFSQPSAFSPTTLRTPRLYHLPGTRYYANPR
ncbi:extensin-like [Limulus polyphemus]|uniref:Extensin-like n=1 Tax=Limulus polyphemus TaxID=6850 RepID=A0ABM1C3I0_LIMPO|nr:extensin-like [Limulus polyphemus]